MGSPLSGERRLSTGRKRGTAVPRGTPLLPAIALRVVIGTTIILAMLGATAWGETPAAPAILVHGFQPVPGYRVGQLWEPLAERLSGNRVDQMETITVDRDHQFYRLAAKNASFRDVFLSNVGLPYEPTWRDLTVYVNRFVREMDALQTHYGVSQCHVIAHSLGGLIARAYIEGVDLGMLSGGAGDASSRTKVQTLIMLATPNHGCTLAAVGDGFSALGDQLRPGSDFLRALNTPRPVEGRLTSIDLTVRYVSMAGQSCLGCGLRIDRDACRQACAAQGLAWEGSDLVVMMASAYLPGAENCALIGYDHVSLHREPEVIDLIETILQGGAVPGAVFAPSMTPYAP